MHHHVCVLIEHRMIGGEFGQFGIFAIEQLDDMMN
jgi:hypothetical protein